MNHRQTDDMAVRRQKDKSKKSSFISPEIWRYIEIFVAETIGTGMMLFFGCISQVIWKEDFPVDHWKGVVVFGCIIATIVQIFANISMAHLNPAVTLCLVLLGFTTPTASVVYVVAECLGAYLGFALLMLVTPSDIMAITKNVGGENFCGTIPHPSVSDMQAITMEFLATGCLILLVCTIMDPRNSKHNGSATPLKFAAFVFAIGLTVGPYTGCSMNPARSLAPALWNGYWHKLWIYFLAPMVSALVVTIFYQTMFTRTTPEPEETEEDLALNDVEKTRAQSEAMLKENHDSV